jgi:DinB family protein
MDAELLLEEYDLVRSYTDSLYADLTPDEIAWRPSANSSGIGWHLGHQAAVNHFLIRNLLSAEPSLDPVLDALFDAATPERDRGALPPIAEIIHYREAVAAATHAVIGRVLEGRVDAPTQLRHVLAGVLTDAINHEYQHNTWICEVREVIGRPAAPPPTSVNVTLVDGYWLLLGTTRGQSFAASGQAVEAQFVRRLPVGRRGEHAR